ncbi:hypothetical protein [Chitinibacter sp. S2-10]|uniref:hypothetical protein n=1 Tax=Chitinibacter sp. S2-10 TaxID=3373597 RepID=UPI003977949B
MTSTCLQWIRLGLLLAFLSLPALAANAKEVIPFYTYYDEPPYALDQPDNLTNKLASWLSAKSAGSYLFVPTYLPRKRLDMTVINQPQWLGVVAWANPKFFDDVNETRYRWSRTVTSDINLVVSHKAKPVNFSDAKSLYGLKVGAVFGRKLADFEAEIQAGNIIREDAGTALNNLLKLRVQRIDATLISTSALPYYRYRIPDLDQWLFIAPTPRAIVARSLFVDRSQEKLMQFLDRALLALPSDPQWRNIVNP